MRLLSEMPRDVEDLFDTLAVEEETQDQPETAIQGKATSADDIEIVELDVTGRCAEEPSENMSDRDLSTALLGGWTT
jgi:hypothetical protein